MRRTAGEEVSVPVFGASGDPKDVEGHARLGVGRVPPNPPMLPEAEAPRKPDKLAGMAGKV